MRNLPCPVLQRLLPGSSQCWTWVWVTQTWSARKPPGLFNSLMGCLPIEIVPLKILIHSVFCFQKQGWTDMQCLQLQHERVVLFKIVQFVGLVMYEWVWGVSNLVDLRIKDTNVDGHCPLDSIKLIYILVVLWVVARSLHILCGSLTIGCETISHKALTVNTDPALNNCSDNCSWIGQEMEKEQESVSQILSLRVQLAWDSR